MPDEQNYTPSPTATGAWASAPAFSLSPTSSTAPPPLSNRDNPRSEATPTRPACGREATERQTDREQQQHVTLQEKPSCPILTARAIQVQPQFQYPMDTREEHCQWEIQQQQQITWLQKTPIRQSAPRQLLQVKPPVHKPLKMPSETGNGKTATAADSRSQQTSFRNSCSPYNNAHRDVTALSKCVGSV